MQRRITLLLCLLCLSYSLKGQCSLLVSPTSPNVVNLFDLDEVRLTNGPMQDLQNLSHRYLLTLEPDRLLAWFRREAGLTPKASPYPAWESEELFGGGPLSGHILSFYLSGMSMMYQSTGDPSIMDKLKYVVDELKTIQTAGQDGYLAATPNGRHVYEDVFNDNLFKTDGGCLNGCWEPVYVMNKTLQGLHDCYTLCGIEEAFEIEKKLADWFGTQIIDKLDHAHLQKLLVTEHGGINESYVEIYEMTGENKYLKWAERLNDERMLIPLSEGKDILRGWHANTQIPKFTGFLAEGRYNGNAKMTDASRIFWDIVINNHTWVNGSNSCGEHFFAEDDYLKNVQSTGGPESCNSVNLMRLTEALYQWDGKMSRVDYYERVLFNHIMANYDPENGMSCYYTSMRPGHYKVYSTPYGCFWCCTGTGLFAPAKLAKMVYAYSDDTLKVNLFVPTTLNWKEKQFGIEQQTTYPDKNESRIEIKQPGRIKISIRCPYWIENGSMIIKVNGKNVKGKSKNGYITLSRSWKKGDKISIQFSPKLYVEPLKKFDQYLTIQYGAYVLGAKIDNHGLSKEDFFPSNWKDAVAPKGIFETEVPHLIGTPSDIKQALKRMQSDKLCFTYNDTLNLIPFSRILMDRYVIYFPHCNTLSDYRQAIRVKTVKSVELSEEQEMNYSSLQVDRVLIRDNKSEESHHIESINSRTGSFSGISWRDANDGGYFMYEMKCLPDQAMKLLVRFRQDDEGARVFDIQVDGKTVRTINHCNQMTGVESPLYYEEIPIPIELTNGKNHVTVKFYAHNHNIAGGIFDLRILKVK